MAAESVEGGIKVVASATSSTVCVGFGACFTAPIPSLIIESGANLILKIANAVVKVANLATISADLGVYISHKNAQLGVTYASGSGDYAEWLQKKDITETFNSGDIVCLKNGRISRSIEEGGKMMVISEKPIVLGNTPAANNELNYAKVAFLGQVPVKVLGKVKKGDYILPSGYDKGFGVGVSPDKMKIGDYKKIVGVAWEDIDGDPYGYVNTAVGLNVNDYSSVIENQQDQLKKQQSEIDDMKKTISQIVAQMSSVKDNIAANTSSTIQPVKTNSLPVAPGTGMTAMINGSATTVHPSVPDQTNILYYKLTQSQIDQMFDMAEKVFVQTGVKFEDHPFWSKIKSDPSYKKVIQQQIEDQYEKALEAHLAANHMIK